MKKKLYTVLEIIFIALFIFSCYKLCTMLHDYYEGDKIYDSSKEYFKAPENDDSEDPVPDMDVDLESLKEINEDIIGWIYIPDTKISYPLLYGSNNDYYLKRTYNRIYSDFGSIFVDSRNTEDFSDNNTIIYGHNTKNGSMFGSLKKYKEKSYLDEHPYVYIILEDKVAKYKIISSYTVEVTDDVYTYNFSDNNAYTDWLKTVCASSEVESPKTDFENNKKVITLSTCTSRTKTERFVVVAELLK